MTSSEKKLTEKSSTEQDPITEQNSPDDAFMDWAVISGRMEIFVEGFGL